MPHKWNAYNFTMYSLAQYDLQRSLQLHLSWALSLTDMHSLGAQSASACHQFWTGLNEKCLSTDLGLQVILTCCLVAILNARTCEPLLISIADKSLHAAFFFFFSLSSVESFKCAQIQHSTSYFKKCSWHSKTTSNAGRKLYPWMQKILVGKGPNHNV